MKIKRAIKAGDPNVNTGKTVIGLEDKLKEYFEESDKVYVDDRDISIRYDSVYHDVMYCIMLDRCVGIVTGFDDEYFYIDITGYGEKVFNGRIVDDEITGYTLGVVFAVDGDTLTNCVKVLRLNLIRTSI